jgi:hypothetical protein
MLERHPQPLAMAAAVRWLARLAALGLLVVFGLFWYAEGPPPPSFLTLALCAALVGLVLAWFSDLLGGSIIVLGVACFYLLHWAYSGRLPNGWVFPLFFVSGGLFLASYFLRTRREADVLRIE